MIQFKKMSRTAVSAAMLVAFGAAANAGTVHTSAVKNVAQEAFGTGYTDTVVIPAATAIGYQFSTPGGIVINPGGVIHVTLTPTNGKFTSPGSVTIPAGTGGALVGAATVNTTTGVMDITLTNGTGSGNSVIGVGGIVSVGGVSVTGAGATLVAGGAVTAVGSVGVAAGGSELEAASTTATTLITSSQAVSVAGAASTTETAKIDVTTTATANIGKTLTSEFANDDVQELGTVTFTSSTTVAQELATTAAVNLLNSSAYPSTATPVVYTLSLASGTFSAGAVYSLKTGGCGGATVGSTQAPTAITAATTSVTLSSIAVPASGTAISVCATFPGSEAIAPYKANIAAALTASTANKYVGETLTAFAGYDLGYNGASVTVRNYIPSGVTGYVQTVRLINTGSSSAIAYLSLIDEVTGVATTPVAIGTAIAPGAAQKYTQAGIEAALGYSVGSPLTSTKRPRLRFTAATGSMEAQTFFNNANGAYTNLTGQDTN
jgi:hypothetical protein